MDEEPIDLSGLNFATLRTDASPAVVARLAELLAEFDEPAAEPVAGFQSSI